MDPDYCDAKDMKDVNYNLKLLIQKYNHEHSEMVKNVSTIKKDQGKTKKDIVFLKERFIEYSSTAKGMKLMLNIIFGIIAAVGTLIAIGAVFG